MAEAIHCQTQESGHSVISLLGGYHPSLILIPGCRVCCVLILLPPSLRRVVPRVSEPFTGTITMSPGSRHQHNTSGTLTLEPAGL